MQLFFECFFAWVLGHVGLCGVKFLGWFVTGLSRVFTRLRWRRFCNVLLLPD